MAKYQKTGVIDHINEHGATYGDQPSAADFHTAMNLVADTESMFEELPSSVRESFDNDPTKFLDYIEDEERRNEILETKKINPEETDAETPPAEKTADPEADPAE